MQIGKPERQTLVAFVPEQEASARRQLVSQAQMLAEHSL